ncbi:hypothetical protein AMTR_s00039p00159460 [Amborella trichopoda]|uniref:Vacuolar protein sorting-associated protein 62 n=2 Tax=Amborella trichopoda TaxID=13333 RepID=U5CRH8_AMBTC|nr:hypothetical protein AMTR_s00039p00159460 [Amborella trichopoda]
MQACNWLCWTGGSEFDAACDEFNGPEPFSLPSPIPSWPPGKGFAQGRMCLGKLEVYRVTDFEKVWSCNLVKGKSKGATFYRPIGIPNGFFCLGHYAQPNDQPLRGFVLVAKDLSTPEPKLGQSPKRVTDLPALQKPLNYTLVWGSNEWSDESQALFGCGYFWLPYPPKGYKAVGFVVTNSSDKPSLEEVRCVRADLTEPCASHGLILSTVSTLPKFPFRVWKTRPCHRGIEARGVPVGTFYCSSYFNSSEDLSISCLKNSEPSLHAMPNLDQVHALIKHYGPTVYFHPDEIYLPSSLSWFFDNGALLYKRDEARGEPIDSLGSNLPQGGSNDGKYWLDLPSNGDEEWVKLGNLESAELYVHVKPALGGSFTDIAMWIFCPFNGPATIKIGMVNVALSKVGQHVCDWEHYTLRICNFSGELWAIYFSQHSGGEWVEAWDLEFVENNRAIIYSSKSSHASFAHPGNYLQGDNKLGIGVRNDAEKSDLFVDSSVRYKIVSAEYSGEDWVKEPCWLQYMREWGPTIVYNSRSELEKIISLLPVLVRFSVENIFNRLPMELYGEEGPTGPKEKNNWEGDERS